MSTRYSKTDLRRQTLPPAPHQAPRSAETGADELAALLGELPICEPETPPRKADAAKFRKPS